MKTTKTLMVTLFLMCASVMPTFAADTTQVYGSGILVLAFLGLCALVILVQLAPALMMLFGLIKGLVESLIRKPVTNESHPNK